MVGCGRVAGGLAAVLMLLAAPAWADSASDRETTVRAAFVFRLAFFIEWPASAFEHADSPLRICLDPRGAEALARTLAEQTAGRTVQERKLDVRLLPADGSAEGCHIVYYGDGATGRVHSPYGVVVVESLQQLEKDAALALVREQGKDEARLVFYGVRERLQGADFTVSSKLLQLLRFHQGEG